MDYSDALDVIARTRDEVKMSEMPTGENLFLVWGWSGAVFSALEFILWQCLHQDWCLYVFIGIPMVGIPLMIHFLRKDRERTHSRTRGAKLILDYWIFAGAACCTGSFILGLAGLFEACAIPLTCLLVGIGSFITGEVLHFRPKIIGGLAGCAIGMGSVFFQGELWHWQVLAMALVAVVALIVPGHLYKKRIRHGVQGA